ncbi:MULTISPECIES: DUF2917 domain-containing protein [Cupriavidus]|jgi:hypothetical protein|uniref:DUF2917 domain-containing protein n=1 Tax=Cupriavidus metallidurans TaxID=119219 RepID=A0A482IJG8_9BURK|nr:MULTISPECIES: DUF2917 domain-containing protein [Cupriavidus]KWR80556.1 hypothetical protein RN01_18905 [Cupriavidus sp. SHE]QBP08281.1 DUF2917 domain-containing protein [Cupriavidus metallidurans]QWC88681.1 DUF2917 domain-containing protein [Cupriavidus metallidurans]
MKALLTTTVFTLAPGEVTALSLHAAQRLFVEDAKGMDVWVTRENDSEDYWLRCGSSLMLRRGDEIVLSVDPRAAGTVRLALIAEARRPALTLADVPHLAYRAVRRLVRGTEWTPAEDKITAS